MNNNKIIFKYIITKNTMVKSPNVIWWQDWTHVHFRILAPVNPQPSKRSEHYTQWRSDDNDYCLNLDWCFPITEIKGSVLKEQGHVKVDVTKTEQIWWPRLSLSKDSRIRVDWKQWLDPDEIATASTNTNSTNIDYDHAGENMMEPPSQKPLCDFLPDSLKTQFRDIINKVS